MTNLLHAASANAALDFALTLADTSNLDIALDSKTMFVLFPAAPLNQPEKITLLDT